MVNAPISKSTRYAQQAPSVQSTGKVVTVRHTEYIADITAQSSTFAVTNFPVNPGLSATFPWLANIAGNFESYRFKKLQFQYKPICPTTTAGKVILALDYDAVDSSPNSKLIMSSYESSVNTSVWDSVTHNSTSLNLNKFGTQRFVRNSALPTSTDLKTYDIGKFLVGTSNTPGTPTTLGEIYVHYEVDLFTPQFSTTPSTQDEPQPVAGNPFWHMIKIIVTAAGEVSLKSLYSTKVIALIAKTTTSSGFVDIDMLLNPTIGQPIKADLGGAPNVDLGRGAFPSGSPNRFVTRVVDAITAAGTSYYLNVAPAASATRRLISTVFTNNASIPGDNYSNALPGFRIRTPFNSEVDLNLFALGGLITGGNTPLGYVGGNVPMPTLADTVINWPELAGSTVNPAYSAGSGNYLFSQDFP